MVRLPREWVGPLDELIPFGPRTGGDGPRAGGDEDPGRRDEESRAQDENTPADEAAEVVRPDFWGEDSAAVQVALEEGELGAERTAAAQDDTGVIDRIRWPAIGIVRDRARSGAAVLLLIGLLVGSTVLGAGALLSSSGHRVLASAPPAIVGGDLQGFRTSPLAERNPAARRALARHVTHIPSSSKTRVAHEAPAPSVASASATAAPASSSASEPAAESRAPIYTAQQSSTPTPQSQPPASSLSAASHPSSSSAAQSGGAFTLGGP